MKKDRALQYLVQELDYSPEKAESVWSDLTSSSPVIQESFNSLVSGESIRQLEMEGYTIAKLIEEYEMTPVAALLTLDWLIKEPEIALEALSEGYDTIL